MEGAEVKVGSQMPAKGLGMVELFSKLERLTDGSQEQMKSVGIKSGPQFSSGQLDNKELTV